MLKNVFYVVSALLASTVVMAQCTNSACTAANAIYKECKYSYTSLRDFQKCLCTEKFLVNYNRCIGGSVCAWDGNPATLNNPCIALYCPGTFDGGFDAKAFCATRNRKSLEIPNDLSLTIPLLYSHHNYYDKAIRDHRSREDFACLGTKNLPQAGLHIVVGCKEHIHSFLSVCASRLFFGSLDNQYNVLGKYERIRTE